MRYSLIVAACATLAACGGTKEAARDVADGTQSSTPPAAQGVSARTVPAGVAGVGTYAENLYDHARRGDWAKATAAMDSLDRSARALRPDELSQVRPALDSLRAAVTGRRREAAVQLANTATRIGATLTERYDPLMPADIVRLDYYGRELEIGAARKDLAALRATTDELVRVWEAVKPQVIAKGGTGAVARTDSLVARLQLARTPADFGRLATPILDVVDELEKPFQEK